MQFIGIDIGGTKISVCIGDELGKILVSKRIPTHPDESSDIGIKRTIDLINNLLQEENLAYTDIAAIGIACPGPVSVREGKVLTPFNLPGWRNVEIVKIFEKAFNRPTYMNHDAKACAMAEWRFGARRNVDNLIYITMSTGIGAGIIANGQVLQGSTDSVGEVGHFVIDINGPLCNCGQKGCFEAFCGGGMVAKRLREEIHNQNLLSTQILQEAGGDIDKIDFIAFINAVKKKDPFACKHWDEFIERLAQGIGIILMSLNPDVILLGTIAIHAGDLLFAPLQKALVKYCWPQPLKACVIEPSSLGELFGDLSALAIAIHGSQTAPVLKRNPQ